MPLFVKNEWKFQRKKLCLLRHTTTILFLFSDFQQGFLRFSHEMIRSSFNNNEFIRIQFHLFYCFAVTKFLIKSCFHGFIVYSPNAMPPGIGIPAARKAKTLAFPLSSLCSSWLLIVPPGWFNWPKVLVPIISVSIILPPGPRGRFSDMNASPGTMAISRHSPEWKSDGIAVR